jgi:aspartyl aminopeptidase
MAKKSNLEEKLSMKNEPGWVKMGKEKEKKVFSFCDGYMDFMLNAKTERESVSEIIKNAKKNNFKNIKNVKNLKPGMRVYTVNREKNIALAVIGKKPIEKGLNIVVSHIDSPRLDLKPNPLYENKDAGVALFKTHYYGGIRKYHWVNVPLALHGKVIKRNGESVSIKIGENPDEPVFIIPDLLPHLSKKVQDTRKLNEGIKGEEPNILVGSIPVKNKDVKEKIKIAVLDRLNKQYGIVEEDFVSAELEAVPAIIPRDIGFDKSMIGAYGQDDKICAYTSLIAVNETKNPEKTCVALFVEKEEIGSDGNTGMKSMFFEELVSDLVRLTTDYSEIKVKNALSNSKALSGDVNAALDPTFKEVFETKNASKLGFGIVITKYTGGGGKYSASDASAEYVGKIRKLFNDKKIAWQTGELGKVDEGGGGTVAKYLAEYNMDVLDCGPPILAMHAPYEVSSKADVYSAYEAYKAFFGSEL